RTLLAPMQPVSAVRESEGWLLPGAHPVIAPLRQLNAAAVTLDELGLGADLQRHTGPAQGALQLLSERLRLSLPVQPARLKAARRSSPSCCAKRPRRPAAR